jgi:hypothetical protein
VHPIENIAKVGRMYIALIPCVSHSRQLVTPQAALLATLDEMHTLGLRMFFSSLTHNANKLLEKVELPPADLGPTVAFQQTLQLLQDVLSSHDSSVIPLEARKQDFAQVGG